MQSYDLGLKTRSIDIYQEMDPDNDLYKPPLFSTPPVVVKGISRLLSPMIYLCVGRFREVFFEYLNDPEKKLELISHKNFYGQNLIHHICDRNHPSNMSYNNNYLAYDKIFWIVIRSLMSDLVNFNNADGFGRTPLIHCLNTNHNHYFFALLNYGFVLTNEELDNIRKTSSYGFAISDKMKLVQNSKLPLGCKLLEIIDICPISLEKITHPIICDDGHIYEYLSFKMHVLKNGYKSPITLENISNNIYHIMEDRFEKVLAVS